MTPTTNESFLTAPLAIIGLACRLPGADNLDEYWQLLRAGRSALGELPDDRLERDLYYHPEKGVRGKSYAYLGGLVKDRPIDRTVCPASEELLQNSDVAHQIICEVAAAACRHAGYDPANLPLRNTGVYIGHSSGSPVSGQLAYAALIEEVAEYLRKAPDFASLPRAEQDAAIAEIVERTREMKPRRRDDGGPYVDANAGAAIISQAFGLTGPHMVLDAACASSLVALTLGAQALQRGDIDMAIVGGASFNKGDNLILFSHAQSCSPSGSRPFDSEADGLVNSEGYVALLIKTLPRALADGDTIHSVIRGIGVSSDGRGRSLWAPRKEGQIEAVRRAYGPGVDVARVQYIEAHATSTQVGDATEINALSTFLTERLPKGHKVPIGSVKANIGHTLETAGMASLVKTVLAMKHATVPPAINIQQLNPEIDWQHVPFFVPREAQPWPAPADGHPRRAAVNAFGIGGLNVHVVLDEFTEALRKQFAPDASRNGHGAPAPNPDDNSIAIVGRAAILPGANTVDEFWQLLISGRDPKTDAPAERWSPQVGCTPGQRTLWTVPTRRGGFITNYAYDWKKHKIPPKQLAHANPMQFMLLDAADQAMRDAGYDKKPFDRKRAAVIVGTTFGDEFTDHLQVGLRLPEFERTLKRVLQGRGVPENRIKSITAQYHDLILKSRPALLDETGSFTSSTLASRVSKTLDLMGGAMALDAGEASSLAALTVAANMLLTGACSMAVCAGAQRFMDLVAYQSHSLNGFLAQGELHGPFDARATGFVPGEGVAVVVLKRLADARRDGDRIHAVIRGVGAGADGCSLGNSLQLATERALEAAGLDAADVSLVEAAGGGVPKFDQQEAQALAAALAAPNRRQPVLLGALAAQIGHTQAASGMAALVKATLEMEHGQAPANLGQTSPTPAVASNAKTLRLVDRATPVPSDEPGHCVAGVSSYASTGLSFHVLLERGAKTTASRSVKTSASKGVTVAKTSMKTGSRPAVATSAASYIVRIGAPSLDDLAAKTKQLVAGDQAATLLDRAESTRFTAAERARLAIVAADAESLTHKLSLAAEQMLRPESRPALEEQGIFCRQIGSHAPRVAFLFPGQGSQYAGMLRDLIATDAAAAAARKKIDAVMSRLGYPLLSELAWQADGGLLGTDVWQTQLSMLLADTIVHAALAARGIRADLVSGQSYGEFPALVAAGVWSLEQAARVTHARCAAIDASREADGAMLSATTSPETIERLAAEHRVPVYVSNHNAPDQTVVGGERQAVLNMSGKLAAAGIQSKLLPVPRPFHTPLMREVCQPLRRALDAEPLLPPRVPMLSNVSNRYVAEPEDIRQNLVTQMTDRVRYVDLIERMADEGVGVFVEVGPQQVLTRLHRRILAEQDVSMVGCDHPKRGAKEQLDRVQALLECVGVLDGVETTPVAMPARATTAPTAASHRAIETFDATATRKAKMRQSAAGQKHAAPNGSNGNGAKHAPSPVAPPAIHQFDATNLRKQRLRGAQPMPASTDSAPKPSAKGNGVHPSGPTKSPAPPAAKMPPAPPQPKPAAAPPPVEAKAAKPSHPDLEAFLVNFVVEQTGYPADIVELDADLEADLGIDSIKKAQLFGELREYFDISGSGELSLDDFTTLRHVLNFLNGRAPIVAENEILKAPIAPPVAEPLVATPAVSTAKTGPAASELEAFLVNFVVEQTGYPAEIVELDADLEADLGIDSIKKAQLFGELREYFDISGSGELSLDAFPTLRHVLDFLRGAQGKTEWLAVEGTSSSAVAPPSPVQATAKAGPDASELESFLVNFVVEQTGYPAEIVELDADLEADLGIDSIKKAQLFGELREYFDISGAGELSLDDFPTLRHVLDFLRSSAAPSATASAAEGVTSTKASSASEAASTAPRAEGELEAFLVNFVVEQTGYPAEIVELDADLEADLGIDSIKKAQLFGELREYFDISGAGELSLDDFPTLRHVLDFLRGPTGAASATATVDVAPVETTIKKNSPASHELEAFLVNFVVEQTGYPAEIVELDADLEADLGIDSIKKAQLFGELREYFDISGSGELSLDAFPTLRHVLRFLDGVTSGVSSSSTVSADSTNSQVDDVPEPLSKSVATQSTALAEAPPSADAEHLLRLQGSPYEMGWQHGQARRAAIKTLLKRIADLPAHNESDPAAGGVATSSATSNCRPEELAEMQGIADGVGVPLGNIASLNRSMYPTYVAGSAQFAVTARCNGSGGMLHGANEDSPRTLGVPDCLDRVIQVRQSPGGDSYVIFSIAGQIGGLNGANAYGVTVTSALLLDRSTRVPQPIGHAHPLLVRRVLEQSHDLESAIAIVRRFPRTGAWSMCISHHPTDQLCYLEYDGESLEVQASADGIVATNHSLLLPSVNEVSSASRLRLTEISRLLGDGAHRPFTAEQACAALRDRHGSHLHADHHVSIVVRPGRGDVWATGGPLAVNRDAFMHLRTTELFNLTMPIAPQGVITAEAFERASHSVDGGPPLDDHAKVCNRFVMRLMKSPLVKASEAAIAGRVLILGDNAASQALRVRLELTGASVSLLPVSTDIDAMLAAVDHAWSGGPAPHLFLMTACDADAATTLDPTGWNRRRELGVMTPYLVCQRWHQLTAEAGLIDKASIVAAVSLGGDCGFSGGVLGAEGGALGGLVKGLYLESGKRSQDNFRAKVVDFSSGTSANEIAERLFQEFTVHNPETEIGYVGGVRYAVRPVIEPVEQLPRADIRRGGVWVVTGGARGITASTARELARRFGLKLHLIGSSPAPAIDPAWRNLTSADMRNLRAKITKDAMARGEVPIEAWKRVEKAIEIDANLRSFAAVGVRVAYHSCDVTDRNALARVLDEVRSTDGPIEGVIHGAGVEAACLFHKKKRDMVSKTIAVKVDGAAALMALTRQDPLRYFAAFGSASGCFGSVGQTDYCLANGMLVKLVDWYGRQRPDCHAISFLWHSWDEVGMAARPETQHMYKLHNMRFLPTKEGATHFIEELRADAPEREVLVTDWRYYKFFFPDPDDRLETSAPGVAREARTETKPATVETPAKPTIAKRYILRTAPAPLEPGALSAPRFAGPVLILGDNVDARALAAKIRPLGAKVHLLQVGDSIEETLAAMDRIWAEGPTPHLFIMTGRDADARLSPDRTSWFRRRLRGVLLPYLVCQRWYMRISGTPLANRASLVAATSLGGDFGFTTGATAPEGGALDGLVKAIHVETTLKNWRDVKLKVIDAPTELASEDLAAGILRELATDRRDVEVALTAEGRHVVRAFAEPAPAAKRSITRGGTWVVTGGARGITAAAALELGRRFGLKLHLIGSSPVPRPDAPWRGLNEEQLKQYKKAVTQQALAEGKMPSALWGFIEREMEIDRNLRALVEAGVRATYHSCNVADIEALARTFEEVRKEDGPIHGVIHGAGLAKGAHFERKTRETVEELIGIRLDATLALMELTVGDPLECFVGFGSISGRFGVNGGTDYSLTADMVCKLSRWLGRVRPSVKTVAFHWHPWGEIGQMVRSVNFGTTDVMKVTLMPPAEACEHLIAELLSDSHETEVLITNHDYYRLYYPADMVCDEPQSLANNGASAQVSRRPLVESVVTVEGESSVIGQMELHPATDPFLLDHRFKGQPLLPAAIGLEALAEAAAALAPSMQVVGFRNVSLVNPLRFFNDQPLPARVRARHAGSGRETKLADCEVLCDFVNRAGKVVEADRAYVRGQVELASEATPPSIVPGREPDSWFDIQYLDGLAMWHGPVFRCLRQASIDGSTQWGRIVAEPIGRMAGNRTDSGWIVAANVFDACLYACGVFVWFLTDGGVSVPESFESVRLGRAPVPGEACRMKLDFRGQQEHFGRFDFTLFGEDGAVIWQVEGYRNVIVTGTAGKAD